MANASPGREEDGISSTSKRLLPLRRSPPFKGAMGGELMPASRGTASPPCAGRRKPLSLPLGRAPSSQSLAQSIGWKERCGWRPEGRAPCGRRFKRKGRKGSP